MFDLRAGSSVASLYAHHLGVTAVQADDWKVVSGGGEGLVCVWEMRMGAKLWEMHNRWGGRPQAQLTKYTRNFYFRLNPGIIDILFLLIHVLLFAKLSKSDTNKIIVSAD